MARTKKTYQTPVIKQVETPVENFTEVVASKPISVPTLIPQDSNIVMRRVPTMEPKHIVGTLTQGRSYIIKNVIHSAIYGDFYLLENGFYVAKVGNIVVKE